MDSSTPHGFSLLLSSLESTFPHQQKTQLLDQLDRLRKEHHTEMQSLKLRQHLEESQYSFTLQQLRNQLDQLTHERDCLHFENQKLKEENARNRAQLQKVYADVDKYEAKIKNQEALIDEYRRSIDEQISLEKQVIKSSFMERELQQKLQFDRALKSMEQNYERKLDELKNQSVLRDYNRDVRQVKKFCSTLGNPKRNTRHTLTDALHMGDLNALTNALGGIQVNSPEAQSRKLAGCSSYSTIDR